MRMIENRGSRIENQRQKSNYKKGDHRSPFFTPVRQYYFRLYHQPSQAPVSPQPMNTSTRSMKMPGDRYQM